MYELREALTKYYKKTGNKYLFNNNLTLNKLASELWHDGIDAAALSRIIKGERLFSNIQLKAFCAALNLAQDETEMLFDALQKDVLSRKGFQIAVNPYSSLDIVDIISTEVENLHQARERGLTSFVMDRAPLVIKSIETLIQKETKDLYKNELYKLLGELYSEKSYASGCTLLPDENMEHIFPLVEKQIEIAKETKDVSLFIKAKVHLAFAFYAQGNYQIGKKNTYFYSTSLHFIQEAISLAPKSNLLKMLCWRLVALNSIYLKKRELFLKAQKHINYAIESESDDLSGYSFIPWALDSISRGQSFFRVSDALKTVEKSKKYNEKISWQDPLREAATIRNELEVLQNLRAEKDGYSYKLAERGLVLADSFKFSRYSIYFNTFLGS